MEKLLNDIIEPHSPMIWNNFNQVFLAETRQETFTQIFYYWVYTTLTTADLETLYTYLQDQYFQYKPPSTEDYKEEWPEILTQKSPRRWLRIEGKR